MPSTGKKMYYAVKQEHLSFKPKIKSQLPVKVSRMPRDEIKGAYKRS